MPEKRTITRVCRTCNTDFLTVPSRVKYGWGHYCSRTCRARGREGTQGGEVEVISDVIARVPLRARDGSVRSYAVVDAADAEFVRQRRWSLIGSYAGCNEFKDGVRYGLKMHRELLGLAPGDGLEVDHINRDKLDNRRSNLRIVPKGSQPQNTPKRSGSVSQYRGVTWHSGQKQWRARVMDISTGKRVHLGYFSTEEAAAEAARMMRSRLMPYAVD